jgi:hypothetical protein
MTDYVGRRVIERNQPKGVKSKMRGRKLRGNVNWKWALKPKGMTQVVLKQGLGVYMRRHKSYTVMMIIQADRNLPTIV